VGRSLNSLGVALALLSSVLLALGGWLQWRGLRMQGQKLSVLALVRNTSWLGGMAASALGTLAYHKAILLAELTLVQPLSSLHVAFTALLSWRGRRVRIRERIALGLCVAGTVVLALVDLEHVTPPVHWRNLAVLTALGAAPILLPSPFRLRDFWPALRAGLCYGLSAVLWKAGMALAPWTPGWFLLMAAFSAGFVGGFFFLQGAFRRTDAGTANALAASLAALFPLPAGIWVFSESPSPLVGVAALLTILGVLLMGCSAPTEGPKATAS